MASCGLLGVKGQDSTQTAMTNGNERREGKMVRKRTASELLNNGVDYHPYNNRLGRRNSSTGGNNSNINQTTSTPIFNYSTINNTNVMLLPSSTNMTSGGSGFLSTPTSAVAPRAISSTIDVLPSSSSVPPAVCDFSGLPLFPPTVTATVTAPSTPSMEDSSSSASAWIDGIIKDLIQNSTNVSIPQLIHNVREIIYPCNPNLAALLEYRLRSLTEPLERRKESLPLPHLIQQQQQQPSSAGLSLNLESGLENLPNFGLHDSSSYVNWPTLSHLPPTPTPTPPPPTVQPVHEQQQQLEENENSSPVETTTTTTTQTPTPTPTPTPSPAPMPSARERKEELRQQKRDEEGLHLLTLLLQCAEAVSADNFEEANKMLLEISELSTPYGTSAQRVAAYFSEAMSARVVSSCLGIYAALPSLPQSHTQKMVSAFQVFNGISPFVKFSHFTANQAIQEAFEREDRVHIIDLDIMQGLQWPGLFHILASRPGGPPFVRLTGLGTSMDALEATGKRLSDFAEKLGLLFEFYPLAEKVGNLEPERLNVSKREAVAVHWLQHSLYDVTGSDTNTLWLLQRY